MKLTGLAADRYTVSDTLDRRERLKDGIARGLTFLQRHMRAIP